MSLAAARILTPTPISTPTSLSLSLGMNNFGEDYLYPFCYFHPRELVVGVCAACLTEKLLVLATKQGHPLPKEACTSGPFTRAPSRKPSIAMPKAFALGFLHRLDSRHRKTGDDDSDDGSILGLDDSFISIKFENNGQVSWDKKPAKPKPAGTKPSTAAARGTVRGPPKAATAGGDLSVVEHARLQPRGGIRWRKRIGHLFQLVRWRRSSEAAAASHAGVGVAGRAEGAERKGWIRSLTRRRTTE